MFQLHRPSFVLCSSDLRCESGRYLNIEIINTGTELMLGRRTNAHAAWLALRLAERGYFITRQTCVSDAAVAIREVVAEALSRADLIITTGGLGPTSDDRTRDLIAELLQRPLQEHLPTWQTIEEFFSRRRRRLPENVRRQALVPEGAIVLPNAHGTAPGLFLRLPHIHADMPAQCLILLPGPPRELHPMFLQQVLPRIEQEFPGREPYVSRFFRTVGLGESFLEEKIAPPLQLLTAAGLELAYCARPGEVDLALSMQGQTAADSVAAAAAQVEVLLAEYIYTQSDERLEHVVVRLLTERSQTVTTAESCTGGLLAHRLTNIPGASAVFHTGWITYANAAKEKQLEVAPAILTRHGAVSSETASAMAQGARLRSGADYALAVTGIAGPWGGSAEKPVGLVYISLAGPAGVVVRRFHNSYDRETFKEVTANQALEMLRRTLLGLDHG